MKKIAELTGAKYSLYATKPSEGKDYNEILRVILAQKDKTVRLKY